MATRTRRSPNDTARRPADGADAARRLVALLATAATHVAADRLARIRDRIVTGGTTPPQDEATLGALMMFVIDLAIFTAPPGRSTAVERLARHARPPAGSLDAWLLDGMTRARFALFSLTGDLAGSGFHRAQDLLTGAALGVAGSDLDGIVAPAGLRLAARLVPFGDGFLIAGTMIPLDDSLIEAVRPQRSADGRSWTNATRAAETLYRYALQHGCPLVPGLNVDAGGRAPFPLQPGDGPVHALAHRLSGLKPEEWSTAENLAPLRALAKDGDAVLDALQGTHLARQTDHRILADAYEHALVVMLDVLQRRAAIGQQGAAGVLAWLDREIADGTVPPEVRTLYQRLKQRGDGPGDGRPAEADGADLNRLRGRIQALRAKTVDQGCTEAEALAAAAKVAELLERYGLSLSDLDLRRQACESFGVNTGRRQRSPIDDAVGTVAAFCDCRCWNEVTPDGTIRHVFFGLPADVEGAHYLYDLIAATLAGETAAFRQGPLYRSHGSGQRAGATRSFQTGLVHGIVGKLHRLKQERAAAQGSGGRDLVPVKESIIDDEMDKLGLAFHTRAVRARRVLKDAFAAGQEAGEAFDVRPGIHDGPAPPRRRGRP